MVPYGLQRDDGPCDRMVHHFLLCNTLSSHSNQGQLASGITRQIYQRIWHVHSYRCHRHGTRHYYAHVAMVRHLDATYANPAEMARQRHFSFGRTVRAYRLLYHHRRILTNLLVYVSRVSSDCTTLRCSSILPWPKNLTQRTHWPTSFSGQPLSPAFRSSVHAFPLWVLSSKPRACRPFWAA